MIANILLFAFVGAFVAIAALGHGLLITAIWPNLLGSPLEPHRDTASGDRILDDPVWGARVLRGQRIHVPH
jgi:hypothetical protein